ncbi:hypothetical protein T4D_2772 [Trichinella pseudospiralis]|uniref:Uncharacterized protein n=1 Tax=Trichinella pseudospiralis TaxID=6337 RepID=A0A0V1DLB7_TRIPS|nr:hypothetical protein T4D_1330 [Trichinella pseudospiralis]KRY61747.1 hypothetical protein T4D_2772 [Trichinella pseudospiralis]
MLMDRFQYVQRVVLKFWQRLRTEKETDTGRW